MRKVNTTVIDRFKEIEEKVENWSNEKKEPTLEKTRKALDLLEKPEEGYNVILVGGTNGKGSTVEFISNALQKKGYSVGTYKSPHLVSCRERIKVNNKSISQREFVEQYEKLTNLDINFSFFEFMTLMSYNHFGKENVDYAVVEVGMGGRLDATNALENPELSVITNVGLEHTQYLGDTVEEITWEKIGIVPENGSLVTNIDNKVVKEVVKDRNIDIYRPPEIKKKDNSNLVYNGSSFSLPVKGSFQVSNAATALKALEVLGIEIEKPGHVFEGVSCPGRMEVVEESPLYIQDGAHNPDALEKVIDDLPEKFYCIFNAVKTKDVSEMIEVLESRVKRFYFTQSDVDWSENPEKFTKFTDKDYKVFLNPREAEKEALNDSDGIPVVAIGSLYLIGALKSLNRRD